jgi:hypothetical protein
MRQQPCATCHQLLPLLLAPVCCLLEQVLLLAKLVPGTCWAPRLYGDWCLTASQLPQLVVPHLGRGDGSAQQGGCRQGGCGGGLFQRVHPANTSWGPSMASGEAPEH